MSAVRLADVRIAFDGAVILDSVDLEIPSGLWVGLIGPNGAGKTTLLRSISGFVPHDGTITIDGYDVDRMRRRDIARSVAYVPQLPLIPRSMTVVDYVLMGRTPYISYFGIETRTDLSIVADVLERLELAAFAQRQLGSLSGGELQRAVLARALAQRAPILLLDEPTAALDVGHQQHVLELVDVLRREQALTVVSAMHDLTLVGQFADALVLMNQGRAVATGTAKTVLTEESIRAHYGASVRVIESEDGILVIPTRTQSTESEQAAIS